MTDNAKEKKPILEDELASIFKPLFLKIRTAIALVSWKQVIFSIPKLLVLLFTPVLIVSFDLGRDLWKLIYGQFFLDVFRGPFDDSVFTIYTIATLLTVAVLTVLVSYIVLLTKAFLGNRRGMLFFTSILSVTIVSTIILFQLVYSLSANRFYRHSDYTSELRTYTYKKSGLYCSTVGLDKLRRYSYGVYSVRGNNINRTQLYPPTFEKQQAQLWDTNYSLQLIYDTTGNKKTLRVGDKQENLTFYELKDTLLIK